MPEHSVKIITTLLHPHPKAQVRVESTKFFTPWYRGRCFVRQVEDSVAREKSSEEDVYYRNDSMK